MTNFGHFLDTSKKDFWTPLKNVMRWHNNFKKIRPKSPITSSCLRHWVSWIWFLG